MDDFPDIAPARPIWLMTLADLALLLVGFFVFLQASQNIDRAALARGIRRGFGGPTELASAPMPVGAAALAGFAPGAASSAADPAALIAWARDAARDGRVLLTITGSTDGSAADVDAATGSAAVLAADRARAVAVLLARAAAVPGGRLVIATAPAPLASRRVLVTTGFAGPRP